MQALREKTWSLIDVRRVCSQIWVLPDSPAVAFEVDNVYLVKPKQRHEQPTRNVNQIPSMLVS